MKKFFRKATAIVATVTMLATMTTPAFAAENNAASEPLSNEAVAFLQEHGVDPSIFEVSAYALMDEETAIANSYNESVLALKDATEANNFTDEQIQKYVDGLISTPTTVVSGNESGIEPYADNQPSADNREKDDGIGYEVKSNSGYYQETAYATLPSVYRAASTGSHSDGYLFYTVSGSGNWGIDVGLAYCSGKNIEGWRGFYLPEGAIRPEYQEQPITSLKAGSLVYFTGVIETNNYLRFRVLDGNNFNTVYYDISYYVGDHSIYRTNAAFNRQITLCNAAKNFNTGAYLRNGQFSDAYIYSSSGYSKTIASNTVSNHRGRFGTNSDNAKQVTVNSYDPWYAENISIKF